MNPISNLTRGLILIGWTAFLIAWETKRALRIPHDHKIVRDTRNLTIAAAAGVVMQFAEAPATFGLASFMQRRGWGILPHLRVPALARALLAVLALDYTLYWWHFLTHRVPFLWRFHQVHHLDRDMDATTALRFHFGEIAISVLFRAGQILVIGPAPMAIAGWQIFLFTCILFHHSNVQLPVRMEQLLARILITPRLHGIHHSLRPDEVNSNWSSGLTAWDWLHATLRTDVPQSTLQLGVPQFRADADVALRRVLTLPFRERGAVPLYNHGAGRQAFDLLQ